MVSTFRVFKSLNATGFHVPSLRISYIKIPVIIILQYIKLVDNH